jgi:GNAT superfamily N-acetyltransferase
LFAPKAMPLNLQLAPPASPTQWEQYFALRWQVLRAPWQQPEGSERDAQDTPNTDGQHPSIYNLGAWLAGACVGCGRVQLNTPQLAQVRYMAVSPSVQGLGVGKQLLTALENWAQQRGATLLELQARENALPFYTACGYTLCEKTHLLFGSIQHFRMEKPL